METTNTRTRLEFLMEPPDFLRIAPTVMFGAMGVVDRGGRRNIRIFKCRQLSTTLAQRTTSWSMRLASILSRQRCSTSEWLLKIRCYHWAKRFVML